IENGTAFDESLYELARWVAEQTLCDLRDAVRLIAPEIMASQIKTTLRLAEDWEERLAGTRSAAQKDVAAALASLGGEADPGKLAKALGQAKVGPALAELRRKGAVTEERTVRLPPARRKVVRLLRLAGEREVAAAEAARLERTGAGRQARLLRALIAADAPHGALPGAGLAVGPTAGAAARALAEKGLAMYFEVPARRDPFQFFGFVPNRPVALTDAQARATQAIGGHLAARDGRTILLYGVTGSGKTEVYLDAVGRALASGRGALVLLPEIGLTAQVLDVFKSRFGADDVAVLHSALSPGERHDEWRRIQSGEARIVLGARSAAFAPVRDLGLIILDEEHDGSYKQDTAPRYHARDVALRRAAQTGAPVVLGSATPSLESYYRAQTGEYDLLTLAERVDDRPLPPVRVVDLREEMKQAPPAPLVAPGPGREDRPPAPNSAGVGTGQAPPAPPELGAGGANGAGGRSVLGCALQEAIADRLARREQAILFLNRRGFASFLLCRDCGFTFRCPHCDVSLTYHHAARLLQCHHCDHRRRAPDLCPKCGGLRLRPFGLGTEKVEQAVRDLFPQARTLRMDRDTMTRKGAHAETLRAFRRGEADILIGTQMVAKGLDFPRVTLVGVVSADTALNLPDFRAGERAFQLLTQVAGRAGRGQTPGEVIVQTFSPEHESVRRAARHDYLGFYDDAIAQRQELAYPPFAHLANAIFADEDAERAQGACRRLAGILRAQVETQKTAAQVLGPVACPLARLRNRYRWHLVVRCADKEGLLRLLRAALAELTGAERGGLSLDIDPLTML
ncbi:MAG: primosomal protein N', partial [Armatimonadetes bacterium]|nr:primosomal protein N' [Armatimonadota bacterium]